MSLRVMTARDAAQNVGSQAAIMLSGRRKGGKSKMPVHRDIRLNGVLTTLRKMREGWGTQSLGGSQGWATRQRRVIAGATDCGCNTALALTMKMRAPGCWFGWRGRKRRQPGYGKQKLVGSVEEV
jgi:hypothetical protein